jgi:hypothetical protein
MERKKMKKKVLMSLVLLIVIGTSAVFAQRVGESVQLGGQTYRVESSSNGRVVLQLVPSLNGSWRREPAGLEIINISGDSAVLSYYNPTSAQGKSSVEKGYFKVGTQVWRNLRSTGNLTWSVQNLGITFNTSNPDVVTGTQWYNVTITMDPSGDTFTVSDGSKYIRAGIQ